VVNGILVLELESNLQKVPARASLGAMHPAAHRIRHTTRFTYEAALSLCAALALFAFYQLHGVSERDRFYVLEQVGAVIVCALSIWGAIRGMHRRGQWNRQIGLITLAVILTTILFATLLSSTAEPPKGQRIEYGEP